MKIFRIELAFLAIILLCSFAVSSLGENDNDPIDNKSMEERLVGTWVDTDQYRHFVKKGDFNDNKGGISFGKNGKLIVRQNAGWCGTPPITYGNFDGTWEMLNDSTAQIEYEFWGGTIEEEIWIESVTKNKLVYRVMDSEMKMDERFR